MSDFEEDLAIDDDPSLAWLERMAAVQTCSSAGASGSTEAAPANMLAVAVPGPLEELLGAQGEEPGIASVDSKWVDPIMEFTEPLREARGEQLEEYTIASACSGFCAEGKGLPKLGVRTRFLWYMDPKTMCYQFLRVNGERDAHHFVDLDEVSKLGRGFCLRHGMVCIAVVPAGAKLRSYLCGFSCTPYSTAAPSRDEGTESHAEAHLWESYVREIKRTDPDEAWGENVMGIAKRESKVDSVSPLQKIVEACAVELPQMHLLVFFVCGRTFGPMVRRRILVHLLHHRRGGARAQERMSNWMQVCLFE